MQEQFQRLQTMQEKSPGNSATFRENLNLLKKTGSDSSITQMKPGENRDILNLKC